MPVGPDAASERGEQEVAKLEQYRTKKKRRGEFKRRARQRYNAW